MYLMVVMECCVVFVASERKEGERKLNWDDEEVIDFDNMNKFY